MSTKHCPKNRSRLPAVGLARKLISVSVNSGDGRRRQTERVHQDKPTELVAVSDGEPRPDGASEQVTNQVGRRRAGPFDELAEPREHTVGGRVARRPAERLRDPEGRGRSRDWSSQAPGPPEAK